MIFRPSIPSIPSVNFLRQWNFGVKLGWGEYYFRNSHIHVGFKMFRSKDRSLRVRKSSVFPIISNSFFYIQIEAQREHLKQRDKFLLIRDIFFLLFWYRKALLSVSISYSVVYHWHKKHKIHYGEGGRYYDIHDIFDWTKNCS